LTASSTENKKSSSYFEGTVFRGWVQTPFLKAALLLSILPRCVDLVSRWS